MARSCDLLKTNLLKNKTKINFFLFRYLLETTEFCVLLFGDTGPP
jgi:hypothetical protein